MAAIGLLMLLTNLLTCSKCLVISVANTMSIIACRSVRNWFLSDVKELKFRSGIHTALYLQHRQDQLLPTCQCSWRCCSCCLGRWAGRRAQRGGSPARPCRCTGSPAHCRRYIGRSWSGPGGPRREPWLRSELQPRPAGPDCSETSRDRTASVLTEPLTCCLFYSAKYKTPQSLTPDWDRSTY